MGTLYELVGGWTKQEWEGESYIRILEELGGYINSKGEGFKPPGIAVNRLLQIVSEIDESIELGFDDSVSGKYRLTEFKESDEFKPYAEKMEIAIQETPKLTARVTNLEALV